MKSAICVAVVVLFAGLASSMGVALPLAGSEAMGAVLPAPRQIVFVDKAELAKLHPEWQDLSNMKTVLASALKSKASVPAGRSRSELAAKAAVEACAALERFEARKYAALKARKDAMKSQMMKSAEADWKADARIIEQTAAARAKEIDTQHAADLVNARMRVSAAEVASTVSKLEESGVDRDAAQKNVEAARADLSGVTDKDEAEKSRVMAEGNAKIEALRKAAEQKIDDKLSAYELDQSQRIADSITGARAEIARELGPSSTPVLFASVGSAGTSKAKAESTASLQSAVAALQARIDRDVDAVVGELAKDKGVDVTFVRCGANVRDATTEFFGLIKKQGWSAAEPALSGLGS